jgi:hypothetical protein
MTHLWSTIQCRTLHFMEKSSLLIAGLNLCVQIDPYTYMECEPQLGGKASLDLYPSNYCLLYPREQLDLRFFCSIKECFGRLTSSILGIFFFCLVLQGNTLNWFTVLFSYFPQFVFLLTDYITYVLFCWLTVSCLWVFSVPQFLLIHKEDPPEQ